METIVIERPVKDMVKKGFILHANYGRSHGPGVRICAICGRTSKMKEMMLVHSVGLNRSVWLCKKGWMNPVGKCQDSNNEVAK